ncbi:hypothetical protein [Mucilaginibacter sp. OK283]|jgi:hypothetical protein|uniref:hypothetical protein n=1 Tax=Mucilaginibacter sp. OK283 TaxID=1881049 RepID=UPI0008D7BF10|nr:hypothetical protein [Mucilaginibacter sp. OK283]SEO58741.1 hypothetical protein SAMN05428947_10336 [Mucilaginibacter sp. OK283]
MTIKPLLLLFLVCITASHVLAQANTAENITLKGIVIDKENSKALAYVSVGILNKPIQLLVGVFTAPADAYVLQLICLTQNEIFRQNSVTY